MEKLQEDIIQRYTLRMHNEYNSKTRLELLTSMQEEIKILFETQEILNKIRL